MLKNSYEFLKTFLGSNSSPKANGILYSEEFWNSEGILIRMSRIFQNSEEF